MTEVSYKANDNFYINEFLEDEDEEKVFRISIIQAEMIHE